MRELVHGELDFAKATVWHIEWPQEVRNCLDTCKNPHSDITNFHLEMLGMLPRWPVLETITSAKHAHMRASKAKKRNGHDGDQTHSLACARSARLLCTSRNLSELGRKYTVLTTKLLTDSNSIHPGLELLPSGLTVSTSTATPVYCTSSAP